ncbi:MAG: Transcriptional regulator, LysR family [Labilithrix sp.]|nr:Transcriptional regulator, LysR family [Labilithrix sp.]
MAEEGTFSAAARMLGLTPSAVSKLVSRIERRLGVSLFDRTSRGLDLTEEGVAYHRHSRRLVAELDDVERALVTHSRAPRGRLVVAAPPAFAEHHLVPALPELLAAHPALAIDLAIAGRGLAGDGPPAHGAGHRDVLIQMGCVHDESLLARKIGATRACIVASPAYLRAHGAPANPEALVHHNCLRQRLMSATDEWLFLVDGRVHPVRIDGNVQSDDPESLRRLALEGLGIACLPDYLVMRDLRDGRLVALLAEYHAGNEEPVHALFVGHAQLASRIRAFVDFVVERFSRTSPWCPWALA